MVYSKTSVKAFFGTKKNPALTENRPAIRLYFFPKKPPYCEKYTLKIALNRKFWYSNQNRLKPKIALTEAALNRGITVLHFGNVHFIKQRQKKGQERNLLKS